MTLRIGATPKQIEASIEKEMAARNQPYDTRIARYHLEEDLAEQKLATSMIGKWQAVTPGPDKGLVITARGDSLEIKREKQDGRETQTSFRVDPNRKAQSRPDGEGFYQTFREFGRLAPNTIGERKKVVPSSLFQVVLQEIAGYKNVKERSISALPSGNLEVRTSIKSETSNANLVRSQEFEPVR